MLASVIAVAPYPNVPVADGIPPMRRPATAISAALGGPGGLNATLASPAAVQAIIGSLSNATALLANVPGAQKLLATSGSAQALLYTVPGVPPVLNDVASAQAVLTSTPGLAALLGNVPAVQQVISGPSGDEASTSDQPWGIFDSSNNPIAVADSVIKFEYLKDWKISDYPVEPPSGGTTGATFRSYNKVEAPFEVRVVLAKGGQLADVTAFLTALQTAAASTDLYSVSTPQFVYSSVNIDHLDYSQEAARGAYLIQVSVWFQQIRLSAASIANDSTQSPSGADPVSGGTVQAQPPTAAQATTLPTPLAT